MILSSVIPRNSMPCQIGLRNKLNCHPLRNKLWLKKDMERHKKPKNKKLTLDMCLKEEMFQTHTRNTLMVLNPLLQSSILHLLHMVRAEIILAFHKKLTSMLSVDKSWTKLLAKRWLLNWCSERGSNSKNIRKTNLSATLKTQKTTLFGNIFWKNFIIFPAKNKKYHRWIVV